MTSNYPKITVSELEVKLTFIQAIHQLNAYLGIRTPNWECPNYIEGVYQYAASLLDIKNVIVGTGENQTESIKGASYSDYLKAQARATAKRCGDYNINVISSIK
jgi:hypothetical protein